MKDYLFVAPFLDPPGGGEGVANWMLQALVRRGSTTALVWDQPDFERVDSYYGTELAQGPFELRLVTPGLARLLRQFHVPHHLLKLSLLARQTKALRKEYRHCLSAFNELDLGGGAVQYIHHPAADFDRVRFECPWPHSRLARGIWPYYVESCVRLASWSREGITSNITIANSQWTAERYLEAYQTPVDLVLYPPPLGQDHPGTTARQEAFLSIARLERIKRWPDLIAIFDLVRARGHQVGLTLAGSRADDHLLKELQEKAAQRPWLKLALDCDRGSLDQLIVSHKYGIHAMHAEHYGMAVAELMLGGCITMVHDSGGQVEIACQPEVRYNGIEDAVEKISSLLSSTIEQRRLATAQALDRQKFTRERFLERFNTFLDGLDQGQPFRSEPIMSS